MFYPKFYPHLFLFVTSQIVLIAVKLKQGLNDINKEFSTSYFNYKQLPVYQSALDNFYFGTGLDNSSFLHQTENEDPSSIHPEASMTIEEVIRFHGYPVRTYTVTTADGYILTIHRIPHGEAEPQNKPREPVLLQHGLMCSSASWVTNTKDKNLAYILADAGYDVWLGNIRGTLFGRNHTDLSPEDPKFWEYSFHHMGTYDVPAVIDFILEETGYEQIIYTGHSMGTTMAFVMLSTQPEYNEKIKKMITFGPVATVAHIRTPIYALAPIAEGLGAFMRLFGPGEFLNHSEIVKFISRTVCASGARFLCAAVLMILCGFNSDQLDQTRLPVHFYHSPAATSIQNLLHYAQLVQSGKFHHHDFGKEKNQILYGQESAPFYDLQKVTTPIVLMWGNNDYLADPEDVSLLEQSLPNVIYNYRVPIDDFAHMDYVWGNGAKEFVYKKMLELLENPIEDLKI